MNLNEDYIWFNQKYFFHKDKTFNPNGGSLEIATTCNSKGDLQSFSPPTLSLSVFNEGLRYSINLKYQDVIDLLNSIETVQQNIDAIYNENKKIEINKIYNGKNLRISFKKSETTGARAVRIAVLNNSTDYGTVIVSYSIIFSSIVELLKTFKKEYIKISFDISNRAMMSYMLDEIRSIKEAVKIIPTSIVPNTSNKIQETIDALKDENDNPIKNELQEGFDKYLKENMDTTEIPKLDEIVGDEYKVEKVEKTGSILVDEILKNDIRVLDSLLTSVGTNENPIEKVIETFKNYYDIELLPGISDDEFKSSIYYSKLFFTTSIQNYMRNNIPIPASIPVIKYQSINCDSKNIDLSYDLLTISIYTRLVKEKLQSRIEDATINKSILYLSLRNFTDIFTFSFLDEIEISQITNCILERFSNFSKSGFFNSFDELLGNYSLQKVVVQDIKNFLRNILDKIIGKDKVVYISELQEKNYMDGKVKLHPKNNLTEKQIVNELVKIEVNDKLNILDTSTKLSKEVQEIFEKSSGPNTTVSNNEISADIKTNSDNDKDSDWYENLME